MGTTGKIKIAVPDALQFKLSAPQVNRVDYIDGLYAIEVDNKCLGVLITWDV